MGLEHAYAVIIVYYEPGKTVPFPVHQPVAVGIFRPRKTHCLTEFQGPCEHQGPEIRLGGVLVKTEDPYCYGAYLVMAAGQELSIGPNYAHKVSLCGMAHNLGNGP